MASKGNFVNALHALGLVSLVLLMQRGEATTFTVGGSKGWCVPSDNSPVYNQWAEKMRFLIGDSILFVYPAASDSVLQVTENDYKSCTTTSPISKYTDGHTEFKFSKSGPYYFISSNKDNCNKNEKLHVVVMADRSSKNSPPAPSPATPSPAPTSGEKQQQAPVASPPMPVASPPMPVASPPMPVASPPMQVASPPMDDGTTLAPSAESNPPNNGAGSMVMSFVGSLAAFVGSSVILAF